MQTVHKTDVEYAIWHKHMYIRQMHDISRGWNLTVSYKIKEQIEYNEIYEIHQNE